MNLTNYHSHTPFCDGRSTIEEFISTAILWRFSSYGVSPHSPLPIKSSCNMRADRVCEYIEEMNKLKKKYEGQIEIYTGMEIDFLGDEWNASIPYFRDMDLDYRIASVHFIPNQKGEFFDIDGSSSKFKAIIDSHYEGDIRYVVEKYFESMINMINCGGYDFIGHADKISMNASAYKNGITSSKWYCDIINDYFNFIANKHVIVEINTKAFESKGFLFPNAQHFNLLKELNIPVVVNSDAHIHSYIKKGYDATFALLKDAGFKYTMQLKSGKWIENPICNL